MPNCKPPTPGLVLARKVGESVVIAEDVVVTVVELTYGKVKLHFQCPKDVVVDRLEIWQRKNPGYVRPNEKGVPNASD
jgi:carbon storage regulator CsrA